MLAGGQRPRAPDPQWHQRVAGEPSLDDEEGGEEQRAGGDDGQRLRGAPPGRVGADDAEHEHREPEGRGDRAGEVETACPVRAATLGDEPLRGHGGDQPDRHVDEQDPAPAEQLGDDAAE